MGLLGILVALGLLIWLAYRGWSVLLLAPAAAVAAAGLAGEPLLAHWTQTFMGSAARFIMQFFPIFLLGALFGRKAFTATSIGKGMSAAKSAARAAGEQAYVGRAQEGVDHVAAQLEFALAHAVEQVLEDVRDVRQIGEAEGAAR